MQTKRFFSTARRWALRLPLITLLLAQGAPMAVPIAAADSASPLLQFTAGGHVVGFAPTQVVLAALDHALRVEFVGTTGVTPVAAGAGAAASDDELTMGRAQPLGVVTYPDLWHGVSVEYRAADNSIIKSTYTLVPGADAAQIRLRYNVPVQVQSDGSLQFAFGRGIIRESAPVAWQEIDGTRVSVPVAFQIFEVSKISTLSTVGFRVGAYDARYPLTIDPNYVWHTFYGSSNIDYNYGGIAVDGSNNVYITGNSDAAWQGDGNTNPLHPYSGGSDIVLVKLNSAGVYQWHTFYGSVSGTDSGRDVAVDGSNNVYITGYSYGTWQGDDNTNPLHAYAGNGDIVVVKLTSAGAYQWHTFYGSTSDTDYGYGIAVDGDNNAYITGRSGATWLGDGDTNPLHARSGGYDIVALKLSSAGAYQWHTFYGSTLVDYGYGIAVDGSNNVYIASMSNATWQGDGSTNPLHAHSGSNEIVVLKLSSAGAYQWHTFYGSTGIDYGKAIAVDGGNNVYVAGGSNATWLGDGDTNPLHAYSGGYDIVALKLSSAGAYQWHTFYGSTSGTDYGNAIAVDSSGNVCVAGESYATWQGDGDTSPLHAHSGNNDDIVALKLSSTGAYQWHTFYGSTSDDYGNGIAVYGSNEVYITGYGYDTWQGDSNTNPIHPYSGSYDIVVLKLSSTPTAITLSSFRATAPAFDLAAWFADILRRWGR